MRYTFTLQQTHYEKLKRDLLQTDGKEHVAFLLCGRAFVPSDPWDGLSEERFLSQEVISLPESEVITSELLSTTWKTKFFVTVLKRAEEKKLAVAVVHSHPKGVAAFSPIDDLYEPDLFKLSFNRNGGDRPHASLIMTPDGNLLGRAWDSQLSHHPIDIIRIVGKRFRLHYAERGLGLSAEAFNRQELAFGKALNQDFSKLRIAVVGCGGTGSAIATFLARLGVGQLLLIDKDTVEMTNLNRLHGASISDAENKKPKVDVMAATIKQMGLGTRVKAVTEWVESVKTANFLKACDVIFGCTDDHRGRLFLNRMAHFYLLPLIDMGLMIQVSKSVPPEIAVLDGRVTVVLPGEICLLCRKIIDPNQAYAEQMRRNTPDVYEKRKEEAYVLGEGDPSPAVVTFTTEVATMALNEFIHRVQGFRGRDGSAAERRRLFKTGEDRKTGAKAMNSCDLCSTEKYWGRGDMTPFLDRV